MDFFSLSVFLNTKNYSLCLKLFTYILNRWIHFHDIQNDTEIVLISLFDTLIEKILIYTHTYTSVIYLKYVL